MRHILLALLLLSSAEAFAAKRLSWKAPVYFPSVGLGSTSSVAYAGSAGSSFEWNPTGGGDTVLLRILTTTAAHIAVGTSPTATSASPILPANTEMILEVPAGSKVSAAPVSTAGVLWSTELVTYPTKD